MFFSAFGRCLGVAFSLDRGGAFGSGGGQGNRIVGAGFEKEDEAADEGFSTCDCIRRYFLRTFFGQLGLCLLFCVCSCQSLA